MSKLDQTTDFFILVRVTPDSKRPRIVCTSAPPSQITPGPVPIFTNQLIILEQTNKKAVTAISLCSHTKTYRHYGVTSCQILKKQQTFSLIRIAKITFLHYNIGESKKGYKLILLRACAVCLKLSGIAKFQKLHICLKELLRQQRLFFSFIRLFLLIIAYFFQKSNKITHKLVFFYLPIDFYALFYYNLN